MASEARGYADRDVLGGEATGELERTDEGEDQPEIQTFEEWKRLGNKQTVERSHFYNSARLKPQW